MKVESSRSESPCSTYVPFCQRLLRVTLGRSSEDFHRHIPTAKESSFIITVSSLQRQVKRKGEGECVFKHVIFHDFSKEF